MFLLKFEIRRKLCCAYFFRVPRFGSRISTNPLPEGDVLRFLSGDLANILLQSLCKHGASVEVRLVQKKHISMRKTYLKLRVACTGYLHLGVQNG